MSARLSRRSGMTLLEMLIGLLITTLVVMAAYAAFTTVLDRREATEQAMNPVIRAATIRRTLISWLRNSRMIMSVGTVPLEKLTLGKDDKPDVFRFTTTSPTPLAGASTTVYLFINQSDTLPERGLVALLTREDGTADSMRVQIDSAIRRMRVEYLLGETRLGVGGFNSSDHQWVNSEQVANNLLRDLNRVRAVRVTFSAQDSSHIHPLLRRPIIASKSELLSQEPFL